MVKLNENEVFKCWKHLNRQIHLKHHEIAQSHGLTLEQFHLLLKLDNLELIGLKNDSAPTIGDMASKLGNAPHTLSEKIKRLEKRGFVEKIRDKDDQRINRVMLTLEGHKMVQDIRTESRDVFFYHALEKLDEKSLDCLVNSFKEIIHELSLNV